MSGGGSFHGGILHGDGGVCGPFRIGRTDDLQIFATIIVAITLVLKGF